MRISDWSSDVCSSDLKAGAWGDYDSYHRANVLGTDNVLDACRAHRIDRLVYTSTPSVTHRATNPVAGGTADTVPYGEDFKAAYAATKTIAEKAERSEEHTSELQSLMRISYAVFCLKK